MQGTIGQRVVGSVCDTGAAVRVGVQSLTTHAHGSKSKQSDTRGWLSPHKRKHNHGDEGTGTASACNMGLGRKQKATRADNNGN